MPYVQKPDASVNGRGEIIGTGGCREAESGGAVATAACTGAAREVSADA